MFKIVAVIIPLISLYRVIAVITDPDNPKHAYRVQGLIKFSIYLLNLLIIAIIERYKCKRLQWYSEIFRFLTAIEELVFFNLIAAGYLPETL